MKKTYFLLSLIAGIFMFSCTTTKPVAVEQLPPAPPQEETNAPILWRQGNFNILKDLKLIKDTVNFFLSDTLKFWGPPKYEYYQGKVQQVDTMVVIAPLTPGKITGTPEMPGSGLVVTKFKIFFEHSSLYPVTVTVNLDKSYSVYDKPSVKVLWFLEKKHETKYLTGKPVN